MGKKLFGVDIAKLVYSGVKQAGNVRKGVLTKVDADLRTTGQLSKGTNPKETNYTCRGFVADATVGHTTDAGTLVRRRVRILSIIGASLPSGIEPKPKDKATFDGVTYRLGTVHTDPAEALFRCEVASA